MYNRPAVGDKTFKDGPRRFSLAERVSPPLGMSAAERMAKSHARSATLSSTKPRLKQSLRMTRRNSVDGGDQVGTTTLKRVQALLTVILETAASQESLTVSCVHKLVPFASRLLDEAQTQMDALEAEANRESAGRYLVRLHETEKDEEEREIIRSLVTSYHTPSACSTPKNKSRKNSASAYLSRVLTVSKFISKTKERIAARKSVPLPADIQRLQLSISLQSNLLHSADLWDFDIFALGAICERPLLTLTMFLFHKLDLFRTFNIESTVLATFLTHIEAGYQKSNAYHNALHAADVVQSVYFLIKQESAASLLSPMDILSTLLSAAIHDFQHPGTNNAFHVATRSELALLYNDQSVLENMHCSEAFRVLRRADCAIDKGMPPEQWKKVRTTIVQLVLATDMSYHFTHVENLRLHEKNKSDIGLLKATLHAADISHPAKPISYHKQWTQRLTEEFYKQGDEERAHALPVSPLMDRERPANTAKSQVGFIDHIVNPLFKALVQVVPEAQECVGYVEQNRAYWMSRPSPRKQNLRASTYNSNSSETSNRSDGGLGSRSNDRVGFSEAE